MECIVINSKKIKHRNIDKYLYFTARELAIVQLVANGNGYKQIAEYLGITPKTVQWHLQQVSKKAGCHNKIEILEFAKQHKLLKDCEASRESLKESLVNKNRDFFLLLSVGINVIIFISLIFVIVNK